MLPELVSLPVSPWSLKARWALHHHSIEYRRIDYTSGLAELWLRWKLWSWSGRVTVPVLFTRSGVYTDGFSIAQWAEAQSERSRKGSKNLFPTEAADKVARWDERCSSVMSFIRGKIAAAAKTDPVWGRKFSPPILSQLAKVPVIGQALADRLTILFWQWFGNKYTDLSSAMTLRQVHEVIDDCKRALQTNGRYLLGEFTYADIAAAVMLQLVKGAARPNGKAGEQAAGNEDDLSAYVGEQLFSWSDKTFEAHFPPSCPPLAGP